jgi:hypothetical protein
MLAAVLAAFVVIGGVAALLGRPADPDVLVLARLDLAAATSTLGVDDLGPLADPQRRAQCLRSAGAAPVRADTVLGGRPVLLGDARGTLLVLATGELGRFRLLVVAAGCEAVLADTVVGG